MKLTCVTFRMSGCQIWEGALRTKKVGATLMFAITAALSGVASSASAVNANAAKPATVKGTLSTNGKADCPNGRMCVWQLPNYGGTLTPLHAVASGDCQYVFNGFRSVWNRTG